MARRGAERAVQRVGRELGGVELGGDQPAQLRGDLAPADARGVEQRASAHAAPTVALPAACAAPQPLASKPASSIVPSRARGRARR